MARRQYFTLTTGEHLNFDQIRFYDIVGLDLRVFWDSSGTVPTESQIFPGGAADVPAITVFLAQPQDFKLRWTLDDFAAQALEGLIAREVQIGEAVSQTPGGPGRGTGRNVGNARRIGRTAPSWKRPFKTLVVEAYDIAEAMLAESLLR